MLNVKTSSEYVGGGGRGRDRRSHPSEGCKRHPKHKQSPGVCSLCLAQKLTQLSTHSSTLASSSSSSSSSLSSYCSSSSSCSSSPYCARRFTAHGKGPSFSFLLSSGKNLLTKSRSVACGSRMRSKEGDKKKKGGFLYKLLYRRNTKTKEQGPLMAAFA
ncbi:Detected protein of unknown function [Hibiscus syriacus]|uniref:Uncharacterized protein n=1 Tax=Hibiscus syriacus TaxID=106335 RepID=A0A6A2WF46_HIBSY|nr:ecdysone-induced protein 75B, isoforms C/D-like [Hibiscus syriacus]KAE8656101.1 Detected protein of unknown function [Hibiscus syriacus]